MLPYPVGVAHEYVRLRFRDGGTLYLDDRVPEWEQEAFEAKWRKVGVKVEWLRSHHGRLDPALELSDSYVTQNPKRGR